MNMICENIEFNERKTAGTHGEALERAVKMISDARLEHKPSLDHGYILFVPDKYTLLAEKLLYSDGGAFGVEALTLNRLYYRVADGNIPEGMPLSRIGAVLTVRRILSEKRGELECYGSSSQRAGFSETVYDNLCQFAASGLSSRDLPYEGDDVTAYKLRDLRKIYEAYEEATAGKYVDSSGRMKLLYELLDGTHLFDNTDVYFACYDGFTPMQARVVKKICEKAEACGNKAIVIGAESKLSLRAKKVLRCRCRSRADELKMAAVRIKDLVKNFGARYGDIAVIAPSADYNRLKRIFDEYGVPFFTDCKYALSSHPLARYLLDMFAAGEHYRNDDFIKLAHNPYSGIDRNDADVFENYISCCALSEGAVKSEFTIDPIDPTMKGSLTTAESVRKKVAALVSKPNKRKIYNGESMCAAIDALLPSDDDDIAARIDSPIEDVRGKILENAALLKEVFKASYKQSVMLEALEEIFSLYSVSVLPSESDCVVVGDTSVFRAGGYKYLFVLSMHEGELPVVMHDDGMLSDSDLDVIASRGAKVVPKIEERNARAVAELYSVLSYTPNEIYVSWCDSFKPSPVMTKLMSAARAAKAEIREFSRDAMLYKLSDRDEVSAEILVKMCPTEAAARELYLLGTADKASGGRGYGYEGKLKAAVGESDYGKRKAEAKSARNLYGDRSVSISRVQEYFACPFRCFSGYALKLKPRPTGEVTPIDIGEFLHAVMEKYFNASKDGDYSGADEKVTKAVSEILAENPHALKGASKSYIEELTNEAVKTAKVAGEQIESGSFTKCTSEAVFGGDGSALRSYEIVLEDGSKILFEGKIDRIDVAPYEGGMKAARIIDYKTGKAEFSLSDIYYGRKIQLPMYLKVAKANGYTTVGMFYFPFSSDFEEKKSSYRLLGMFDSDYAYEMDNGLIEPSYASTVVKAKSTAKSGRGGVVLDKRGCDGVESEVLQKVCDYAERVFTHGVSEMLGGYCEPSPLAADKRTECDHCNFKPFCTAYGCEKRERKRGSVKAPFIVECVNSDDIKAGAEVDESGKQ